jgi:hypothetical protein
MKRHGGFLALLLLSGSSLSAAIIGTFDIAGTITVTQDTIQWTRVVSPTLSAPEEMFIQSATGVYTPLAGTIGQIFDLERADSPVDPNPTPPVSNFTPQTFIRFPFGGYQDLNINHIWEGIWPPDSCFAQPAAVGQVCTPGPPATPSDSPFSFVNQPGIGPNGPIIQSEATFVFDGVASGLGWFGIFTSQFPTPFQDVLSAFAPNGSGSVTNTYSATITVFTQIPEPATISMIGMALILGPLMARRLAKRKDSKL